MHLLGHTYAGQHVDHGQFWVGAADHSLKNSMFWDAIIMPDGALDPSAYIVSDGYGGAHALLWSGVSGNMWFNTSSPPAQSAVSYSSGDDNVPPGVFSHVAVYLFTDVYGFTWLVAAQNGIPTGKSLVPAGWVRAVLAGIGGEGPLLVGGSDHSQQNFYLHSMRGFESSTPLVKEFSSFVPPRSLASAADFLAAYGDPVAGIVADLSSGYDGVADTNPSVRTVHPGKLERYIDSGSTPEGDTGPYQGVTGYPLPTIEYFTNTPMDPMYVEAPVDRGLVPEAVPGGARIFDSFSRADQEFFHVGKPTLGMTEGGSLGPLAYTISRPFGEPSNVGGYEMGIYNGRAVCLGGLRSIAYVDAGAPDMDVRVTRSLSPPYSVGDGSTGVAVHMVDGDHGYVFMAQEVYGTDYGLYAYRFDGGGAYQLVGAANLVDHSWSALRVTAVGQTLTVYTDDVARYTVTDTTYDTATGAGIYMIGSGLQRTDDFTVY